MFERCLIDGNLSALIISGFPNPDDLAQAWGRILGQYTELLEDLEYKLYVQLYREVELLKLNYECVQELVTTLRSFYSPFLASELNLLLKTNCKFNAEDVKSYYAELDKCERRGKAFKLQLDYKMSEFEALKQKVKRKDGEPIDKNYFTRVLVILSRFNQFMVSKDIMVNVYCEMLRQYNDFCESQKKPKKRYR